MNQLLFGTAGTPISSKARSSVSGIEMVAELGLRCMELEFVRGVKMGEKTAREVNDVASNLNVSLSVHAPYYINLNSEDTGKFKVSVERIKQSARIGSICGAKNIVFHPGFYLKSQKSAVYTRVKEALTTLQKELYDEGLKVMLRPETTGKRTQFGSLDEILSLSTDVQGVLPCVDFSHLHSRTGAINKKDEFEEILNKIEDALGRHALDDMHIHLSGIEYTKKGEKRHLNLNDSDLKYTDLLKTWKEFSINGLVICESPNLEGDALLLKETYLNI